MNGLIIIVIAEDDWLLLIWVESIVKFIDGMIGLVKSIRNKKIKN